jgi:4-hydroxybenzoate polyprenyltransferase
VNASVPALAPLPARLARLVKIEHTVFALPFAYVGAFLAVGGTPSAHDLVWITLAMVGARSLAMAINRLVDAGIDARNPRTAGREIPSGQLSILQVLLFCAASLVLFLVSVWQLAPLTHWLWPIPVAGFVIYPYLKRTTCHGSRGCSVPPLRSGSPGSTASTRCSTSTSIVRKDSTRS